MATARTPQSPPWAAAAAPPMRVGYHALHKELLALAASRVKNEADDKKNTSSRGGPEELNEEELADRMGVPTVEKLVAKTIGKRPFH